MTRPSRLFSFALVLTAAMLFFISERAQGQTDAKPKGTGSISGRVTIGGKAAFGITVAAFGGDSYPRRSGAKAVTDSEGRYRLFGLGPGTYQVQALAPALVTGETNTNPYGAGKMILLSPAEAAEDIDIKLVRGAVVTGRITDEEGKPVIEERVNIEPVSQTGDQMQQMNMARMSMNSPMYVTDDRGIYRVYGLAAGRYKVSVGKGNGGFSPGNARGRFAQVFYGDTGDAAKAVILELTEGSEASNIDIRLGHRSSTYSVTGRVVDSDSGTPVGGARLMYGRVSGPDGGSGVLFGGLPTNARGEFRFDGLEPGRYTIYLSSSFQGGDFYSQPINFTVIDRDVTNLELKAIRGLTLSGIVVPESDAGKNAAAQLAGLRITAGVRTTTNPPVNNSGSSMVAADGSFSIGGMAPGKATLYLYSMTNGNSRRFSVTRIEADGVDQTQGIDLQPGRSVSNIRVFVSYGTGVIRGSVKFENGSPPPETRIFVGARRDGKPADRGTLVDVRGHFLIPDLPPGTYEVTLNIGFSNPTVQPPARPRQPQKQFVTVADDTEVEVNFTVDLKPKEGGP
jgi:protocatechuate 3,4-dioxygenase beta subunit